MLDHKKQPLKYFSNIIPRIATVYLIINTFHNTIYVGQSTDTTNRAYDHASDLKNNRHRNTPLQNDFNLIKSENYDPYDFIQFQIIYSFVILKEMSQDEMQLLKNDLLNREKAKIDELVSQGKSVYNRMERESPKINTKVSPLGNVAANARPCQIKGEFFSSVSAAAKCYQVTTDTIVRRLENPKFEWNDWFRLTLEGQPILKDGRGVKFIDPLTNKEYKYYCLRDCWRQIGILIKTNPVYKEKGIDSSLKTIETKCNNLNDYTFEWIPENENDMLFENTASLRKPVIARGIKFSSVSEAAKLLPMDRKQVLKFCGEEKDGEWYFLK